MTFEEFSARNLRRCVSPVGFNHPLSAWSLSDWVLAAAGELGEAMNVAKKLNRARDGITGNDKSEGELRSDLSDELADTVIYLDLAAQSRGINLAQMVEASFEAGVGREAWGPPVDLSNELLSILVNIGNVGAMALRIADYHRRQENEAGLVRALGAYMGDATRRIFSVMESRGLDPMLALDIKFRRTSAKIGYVEPDEITGDGSGEALPPIESAPVGRVCASGDCAGGGGSLGGPGA